MQPTLNPDSSKLTRDIVLLDRTVQYRNCYNHGDVVVFKHPNNAKDLAIKRISALPGDLIRTEAPYPSHFVRIPDGHCWIEGDEPFHSHDSNNFGPIPLGLITGRVSCILFPFTRFGVVPQRKFDSRRLFFTAHSKNH